MRKKIVKFGANGPRKRIALIAPAHPNNFWIMQGTVDAFGAKTIMPNPALATLISLTPRELPIEYVLCDENVEEFDPDIECDLAAITGSTLHFPRIKQLVEIFRKRGIPVALGGSQASIRPEDCEAFADHLFIGEAEYTWGQFLNDWLAGKPEKIYRQEGQIDLADSPPPNWSLINQSDYLNMTIQTSRGCPHSCDFCDVIVYLGRRYRTKPIPQIMDEIIAAHKIGAYTIFFSDDNFMGSKKFTRDLLDEIIDWNKKQSRPLSFSTQITVSVADDDEMLRRFADAKFSVLFIGVESVRPESLAEAHKTHNINNDVFERVRRISRYGIVPYVGMIVGFDADDATIFDDIYRFIDDTYSPIVGLSLLNAPKKTPLYERLAAEGRLYGGDFSGEWQYGTNVIPKQMTREELFDGYRELYRRLYQLDNFESRLYRWLDSVEYFTDIYQNKKFDRQRLKMIKNVFSTFLFHKDPEVRSLFFRSLNYCRKNNPKLIKRTITLMGQFVHFNRFVSSELADDGAALQNRAAPPPPQTI